uniref:Uncharacterized protein n=1 Tax=Setaria italica TaxID=4555 RepID=K4AI15_SETIT
MLFLIKNQMARMICPTFINVTLYFRIGSQIYLLPLIPNVSHLGNQHVL